MHYRQTWDMDEAVFSLSYRISLRASIQSGGARSTRNLKVMGESDKVLANSRETSHLLTFWGAQAGLEL